MKKNEFHPKHSLGQNFLTDETLLTKLVELSGVSGDDSVLEIGPGQGSMTRILAQKCKHVRALEVDETLLPFLRMEFASDKNVEIIHGDVMRVNLHTLTQDLGNFKIVANLPYYLTTPLLTMLISNSLPIASMSFMIQKEAAERLLSRPKSHEYCPMAIRIEQYYDAEYCLTVPSAMFSPPPKVDSAFIRLDKRTTARIPVKNERALWGLVDAAFALRRKTLVNNLMNAYAMPREAITNWLDTCSLPYTVRAEEMTLEQYALLCGKMPEAVLNRYIP